MFFIEMGFMFLLRNNRTLDPGLVISVWLWNFLGDERNLEKLKSVAVEFLCENFGKKSK